MDEEEVMWGERPYRVGEINTPSNHRRENKDAKQEEEEEEEYQLNQQNTMSIDFSQTLCYQPKGVQSSSRQLHIYSILFNPQTLYL